MLAVLSVEARKLNRSLAALLAVAAPTLIAIFVFFNMLRGEAPQPWEMYTQGSTGIWAFFMLPMSVTALTALVAHMEHGPRAWDHLRALPVARWKLYAAKAICVLAVVAAMSVMNLLLTWGAVSLAATIKPVLAPTGVFDLGLQLLLLGKVMLAATLMIAIQFWIALRFSSFVPALAVGIGGTFFSVVATAAKQGVFFPWQMPVNMLAGEAWRAQTALALGGGLGAVALVLAVIHLARREVL
jgi:ABC-2 type transport system permease protein